MLIHGGGATIYGGINGPSGAPVVLADTRVGLPTAGSFGPLTALHTAIVLGQPMGNETTLTARSIRLASGTTLSTPVGGGLRSTGPISLHGATLTVGPAMAHFPCQYPKGEIETVVSTTGQLNGRFANAPEGARVSEGCELFRIHYVTSGSQQVTLTSLGEPTQTVLSATPSPAASGQPIALTATVSGNYLTPRPSIGTVAFTAGGVPLPGCDAVATVYQPGSSGATFVATCQTSLAAATHPVRLRARFTPNSGNVGFLRRSAGTFPLTVS